MTVTPKQKVRWGILSTARIADKVSRAIRLAENAELAAIASRTEERARGWALEHGVDRAYGNYNALLDEPDIDAVYIPLPPSMHAEWTIKAAECGKHVLCEKPFAANAEEAAAMAAACRTHNVHLMDGVMWVHHERTFAMKQIIANSVLGRMRRVTAAFTFNWEKIPEENIRLKKEFACGCLGDLGYYCIRAILWAFGDLPDQVFATARYYRGTDFNLSGTLWFRDERMASFDCGFDVGSRMWFEIAGTRASLICDDFVDPWKEGSSRFWVHDVQGKAAEHKFKSCIQEVRMIERFSEWVQLGQPNHDLLTDAIDTMRICDALHKSARCREIIKFNP